MPPAGGVHHLGGAAEAVDRLGDEALPPGPPRRLDLPLAVVAGGGRLGQQPAPGAGQVEVAEQAARRRHLALRQVKLGRAHPFVLEQGADGLDRRRDARHHRIAALGIGQRMLHHLRQRQRAVVPQQQQPGIDRARHHRREQAAARHQVEPELAEPPDGGGGRRHALAADHLDPVAPAVVEQDRHLAARAVIVRLDHLQGKAHGDRGIEGVAALLEDRHAGGAGQPVGRGDDPEGADDLGPGGEHEETSESGRRATLAPAPAARQRACFAPRDAPSARSSA